MRRGWIGYCVGLLLLVALWPATGSRLWAEELKTDTLSPLYRYTEGVKLLHIAADTLAARASFEEALRLDSTYAPAHFKLLEILMEQAPKEAAYHGERAVRSDTTNKFYLQGYAQAQVMSLNFREALNTYRLLMRLDRHNSNVYRLAALLEDRVGNRPEAIAILDSAEVLFGHIVPLGELKFQFLYEERLFERAQQEAEKNHQADPGNPDHLISLAQAHFVQGIDSLARHSLERALELDSTNLRTLFSLAHIYRTSDMDRYFSVARRLFAHPELPLEEKLRIHTEHTKDLGFYRRYYLQIGSLASLLEQSYPSREEVVDLYADHLIAIGEIEQVLSLYKSHLNDQPPVKAYYEEVIGLERYLERPDSALHYMEEAILRFERDPGLRILRGHLTATLKQDYRKAVDHYKEALRLADSDSLRSVVWGLIGDLYQQEAAQTTTLSIEEMLHRGEQTSVWKRAMKQCYAAYDKALRYDPDNCSVMNNYAYFLSLEERELTYALSLSNRVMEIEKENPTYMDTHAWVLFKLGRLEEARQWLRQAVSLDGQKSADLQVHYGDVLNALGEGFMAETYWKRALENGYNAEAIVRRIEERRKSNTP